MTLDAETLRWLFNLLILGVVGVVWQDFRATKSKVEKNESNISLAKETIISSLNTQAKEGAKELSDYKLHVAEHYPTHTYLANVMESLLASIHSMSSKIDGWDDKLSKKMDKN